MQELGRVTDELRLVLAEIEPKLDSGELPTPALEELKRVVDGVRITLLAYVNAPRHADYNLLRRKFRLRRAKQTCDAVREALNDGAIDERTDGLCEMRATVLETAERIEPMLGQQAQS